MDIETFNIAKKLDKDMLEHTVKINNLLKLKASLEHSPESMAYVNIIYHEYNKTVQSESLYKHGDNNSVQFVMAVELEKFLDNCINVLKVNKKIIMQELKNL
jgi:hypothetical protein